MANDDWIDVRIRLRDARRFQADAAASAAAVRGIGTAADTAGGGLERAGRRSVVFDASMSALRRTARYTTLALAGIGIAATIGGFRFNAAMESNTLVMGRFLGSAQAAQREMGFLFDLAARTPFEFGNVTSAARSFLAMGFSLRETNRWLETVADTAAGLQLGGGGVEHLTLILGQIRASGRLLGQDMRQLQQLGINTTKILREQLHLSEEQVQDFMAGQLRIPAEFGLPALLAGLSADPTRGGFGGLAAQLQGTWQALTSTAKDYVTQLSAAITHPFFLRAEAQLRRFNPLLLEMTEAYKTGGFDAMVATLDSGVGANGRIIEAFDQTRAAAIDLFRIVTGVGVPALGALWAAFGFGSPVMRLVLGLLNFAADHTTLLTIVLGVLAARIVYTRSVTLLWALATRLAGRNLYILTGTATRATAATQLHALWTNRAAIRTLFFARVTRGARLALLPFTAATRLATAAMVGLNAAFLANPVVLIVTAVVLAVAAFGLLYWKVKAFRDFVNRYWPYLATLLLGPFAPLGALVVWVVRNFDTVQGEFWDLVHGVGRAWDWLRDKVKGIVDWIVGKVSWFIRKIEWAIEKVQWLTDKIPGVGGGREGDGGWFWSIARNLPGGSRADGGPVSAGRTYLVGERGPELFVPHSPGVIQPLDRGGLDLNQLIRVLVEPAKVLIDGREVAEVVFSYETTVEALA